MLEKIKQYFYESFIEQNDFLYAAKTSNLDFIRHYLSKYRDNPTAINCADKQGNTALILAAKNGHTFTVALLLTSPLISINQKNLTFYTYEPHSNALIEAAARGHYDIVNLLLSQSNIDLNATDYSQHTALHLAVINNRIEVVRLLLSKPNLNVNQQNNLKQTALMSAVRMKHHQVMRLLLAHSTINVNIGGNNWWEDTALSIAIKNRNPEAIRALLGRREIDLRNIERLISTAAIYDDNQNNQSMVELIREMLLERHNLYPHEHQVAVSLLEAAALNDLATVQALLAQNPQIMRLNTQDAQGNTAIMYAVLHGNDEMLEALLSIPALNLETVNHAGHNAAQLAQLNGHTDMAARLLSFITADITMSFPPAASETTHHIIETILQSHTEKNLTLSFSKRLEKINSSAVIPEHLMDPITRDIINTPITPACGITYDLDSLINLFKSRGNPLIVPCAITRLTIKAEELNNRPTVIIKTMLEKFVAEEEKQALQTATHQEELINNQTTAEDPLQADCRKARNRYFGQLFQAEDTSTREQADPVPSFVNSAQTTG